MWSGGRPPLDCTPGVHVARDCPPPLRHPSHHASQHTAVSERLGGCQNKVWAELPPEEGCMGIYLTPGAGEARRPSCIPPTLSPPECMGLYRGAARRTQICRDTSCQINALKKPLGLLIFSFNVHCVEHYTVHTFYNDHMIAMYVKNVRSHVPVKSIANVTRSMPFFSL